MKSMKSKILTPFLILLLVVLAATILLFNLSMRAYLGSTAKKELLATVKTVNSTADSALSGVLEGSSERLSSAFLQLGSALRISRQSLDVEMTLFNQSGELLYPRENTKSFVGDALVRKITRKLPSLVQGKAASVRVGGKRYYITPYPIGKKAKSGTIVFVARTGEGAMGFIRAVNLILLAVLALGAAAGAFAADRVARRLSKPVTALCAMAEEIGKGRFSPAAAPREPAGVDELDALSASMGEMARQLEASDQAQKTFLQNASHELKTPLMSIQGYAEGIASGVLPDTRQAATIIESESRRMGELVEELLTLSRIESGVGEELAPLNLRGVLGDLMQRLGGLCAKQNKQLSLSLPEGEVWVRAKEPLLFQAVMNVASNCLRYAKTTVEVALLPAGESIVLRISDDGDGISPQDLPHLFKRFYKGKNGSFGLGLAIARSAAEQMGGSISAANGRTGAVFEITLPTCSPEA